jgi:hypothetical protein
MEVLLQDFDSAKDKSLAIENIMGLMCKIGSLANQITGGYESDDTTSRSNRKLG